MKSYLSFTLLLLLWVDVLACSCIAASIEDHFENADFVFRAKVISVDIVPIPKELLESEGLDPKLFGVSHSVRRAKVEVITNYKGDSDDVTHLYTETSGAACSIWIEKGDDFVFFTTESGRIGLCGGSLSKRGVDNSSADWDQFVCEIEALR